MFVLVLLGALLDDSPREAPAAGTAFFYTEGVAGRNQEITMFDRGYVYVPVNRKNPDSGVLAIEVCRFPARSKDGSSRPPIFRLHGGPGFEGLGDRLQDPAYLEREIEPYTAIADLVVVGQRGIGSSKPNTFLLPSDPLPVDREVDEEEEAEAVIEACKRGREFWEERGLDLQGFNVIEAAADVDSVRRAFGYDKITIVGGSFGSHWGMTVIRYHRDIVARALLNGLEGPDHTYDRPTDVLAALERMAQAAERARNIRDHVPDGGLISAFAEVITRLDDEPVTITVNDPRSGARRDVLLNGNVVRGVAKGYSGSASSRGGMRTWPADVLRLHRGDYEPLARAVLANARRSRLPTASFFMLDCGSGITEERHSEYADDPAIEFVGPMHAFYDAACSVWDSDLGDEFRQNFETDVPLLIVQGNWDVSTPMENALELMPFFTNGHMVTIHGGSHSAYGEAMAANDEFREAANKFLAEGDLQGAPTDVYLPPLQWANPQ